MRSVTFETGLSDHHKLTATILRKTSKGSFKKMFYKGYKKLDSTFQAVLLEVLNKIAPVKVKVLHSNNNAFMTESLRKAIMLRSRLKNSFIKKKKVR